MNNDDVGFPGNEKIIFPVTIEMVNGFPGFTATPEMITPGFPKLFTTFGVMSFGPTDTPPEVMTTSADFKAFFIAFNCSSYRVGVYVIYFSR